MASLSLCKRLRPMRFQYPRLLPYDDALRILCLLPSKQDGSMISCMLASTRLEGCKDKYIGASYVWGTAEPSHRILINGCVFSVRANLHEFLFALRAQQGFEKLYLWVDAKCIDQLSIGERNQQVQQMGDVYNNAKAVYAWLGPDTHDTAWFFSQSRHENETFKLVHSLRSILKSVPGGIHFTIHQHATAEQTARRILASLAGILSCQYWTRIWIVQELLLAKQVIFFCGSNSASHAILSDWFYSADLNLDYQPFVREKLLPQHNGHSGTPSRLLWRSKLQMSSLPRSLPSLIDDFTASLCSIPQDKIFALLGMMSPTERQYFIVDYSLPVTQVLCNVLQAISHGSDGYNIVGKTWRSLAQMSIRPSDLRWTLSNYNATIEFQVASKSSLSHAEAQKTPYQVYVDTYRQKRLPSVGADLLYILSSTGSFVGQIRGLADKPRNRRQTRLYGFAYCKYDPLSHFDAQAFPELDARHKHYLQALLQTSTFSDAYGDTYVGDKVFGINMYVCTTTSIIICLAICEALIMLQIRRRDPSLEFWSGYLSAELDHAEVNEDGFMQLLRIHPAESREST